MLEKLKKKKLLESLSKGGKDSMKEKDKLEEQAESPSFEASEDETDEQIKKKKKKM